MFNKNLPNHVLIPIPDDYITQEKIVDLHDKDNIFIFEKINIKKMLAAKVRAEDVIQHGIGNCFFLGALASIIEGNPDAINKMVKITKQNGKEYVDVTLHDLNNPDKLCTYRLDPTKIVSKKMDCHTHDVIFLLEKAFAMHRIVTQKEKYHIDSEWEILNLLEENQFNIDNTVNALIAAKEENFSNLDALKQENRRQQWIKTVKEVNEKHTKNYQNYLYALKGGDPSDVYTCLLGVPATLQMIPEDFNAQYLLVDLPANTFKVESKMQALSDGPGKLRIVKVLEAMFDSITSPEASYFFECLCSNEVIKKGVKALEELKQNPETDSKQALKYFYKQIIYDYLLQSTDLMTEGEKEEKTRMVDSTFKKIFNSIDEMSVSAEYLLQDFILDCFGNKDLSAIISVSETLKKSDELIELDSSSKEDSGEVKEVVLLKKIFTSLGSAEAKCFFELIQTMHYLSVGYELFENIKNKKFPNLDLHAELKKFYNEALDDYSNNYVNTLSEYGLSKEEISEKLKEKNIIIENTRKKIFDFINKEVPYGRGLGQYTSSQLGAYQSIKSTLKDHQLITLVTRKMVGSSQRISLFSGEAISKGLVGYHAYQVVNCYEQNGLKYILIRNTWGEYGRKYKTKKKTIGDKEVNVLSAHSDETHLPSSIKIPNFFKRTKKNEGKIHHLAIPINEGSFDERYDEKGYIKLELSDLTKRFYCFSATTKKGGVRPYPEILPFRKDIHSLLCSVFKIQAPLGSQAQDELMRILKRFIQDANLFLPQDLKSKLDVKAALAVYYYVKNDKAACENYLQSVDKNWKIEDAFNHIKIEFKDEPVNFNDFIVNQGSIDKSISSYSANDEDNASLKKPS